MSQDALSQLQDRLGYRFADDNLLQSALHHIAPSQGLNYQRLEFVGDSLIGSVVAQDLYRTFPDWNEGDLARGLSHLVCGDTLSELARELELDALIKTAAGTEQVSASALEDAMEALVGAVWVDSGWDEAHRVVLTLYAERLASLPREGVEKPIKNQLQEWAQARGMKLPDYQCEQLVEESDETLWRAHCSLAGERTSAEARNKILAENAAAQVMLLKLESPA